MNLLFFQNCISPHQMPYIKELPHLDEVDCVAVIAPEVIPIERAQMGWNVDHYLSDPSIRFMIAPTDNEVTQLLSSCAEQDTVCLFSGIRDFPDVYRWFRLSLGFGVRRAIIRELPNTFAFHCVNGKPLWLHRLRFFFRERCLARYVDYVFTMGDKAIAYYQNLYHWKVFPFCYCTESLPSLAPAVAIDTPLRLCYIGSLYSHKNVSVVIEALSRLPQKLQSQIVFNIIGDGPQHNYLHSLRRKYGLYQINFMGSRSIREIPYRLAEHDAFILPSLYDGWGAVVNEALLSGLYTLCSTNAGACILINEANGKVFDADNIQQITEILGQVIVQRAKIRKGRSRRVNEARSRIGGKAIATIMVRYLAGADSSEFPI